MKAGASSPRIPTVLVVVIVFGIVGGLAVFELVTLVKVLGALAQTAALVVAGLALGYVSKGLVARLARGYVVG